MRPSFPVDYQANRRAPDAELLSGVGMCRAGGYQLPDGADGSIGEFRHAVRFAGMDTPLSRRIGHIIAIGSQEQMVGVHAAAVVALVTNEQPIKDGAIVHHPRQSMRGKNVALSPVACHVPVATFADRADPQPARFGFLNFGPEAMRKCSVGVKLFGSHVASVIGDLVRSLAALARCKASSFYHANWRGLGVE